MSCVPPASSLSLATYSFMIDLIVITQCCIVELYKMGKERQPAVDLAKSFERRKCNHREAIEGDECLRDIVGAYYVLSFFHKSHHRLNQYFVGDKNKHRYVIATQSHELRKCLRKIQAVPLVHVKKSVMVLEPPSEETLRVKEEVNSSPFGPACSCSTTDEPLDGGDISPCTFNRTLYPSDLPIPNRPSP